MRMLEAARRAWNDAGRAPADLRYETFGSSGLKPTAEFRVRLKGTDTELVVPQNSSMLDALNGAGFEVISDCQRGECGVCADRCRCRRGRDRSSRRVLQRPAEARQPQDLPLRVARDRCRHDRYAVPAGSGASLSELVSMPNARSSGGLPQSNAYRSCEASMRQLAFLQKKGVKFDRRIDHPARSSVDAYSYSALANKILFSHAADAFSVLVGEN